MSDSSNAQAALAEQARLRAAPELFWKGPLRFADQMALAALPWFEVHNGALVVSDPSVGDIIDVHTHITLPSLRHTLADVERETQGEPLLLPACCPHHLDVYANQLFSDAELRAMKRELTLGALRKRGKRVDQTLPNLMRDLRSVGVTQSVVLGIDMGIVGRNVDLTLRATQKHSNVIGFGSVHPRRSNRKERFEEQLHLGARGIKIHPPNMFTRPDHPRLMQIYGWASQERVPIFWHCGPAGIEPALGAYCGQVAWYEAPLREHPKTTFVLGHSGARQCHEAIALAKRYPNAYLDISCISLQDVRRVVAEVDPERILFGSDWPFYHPVLPLAKVLLATEGFPVLRRKILHDNAARLFGM